MISEDDDPVKLPLTPRRLEDLSTDALKAYLEALDAEIVRVNEFIAERGRARSGAEQLFQTRRAK